MPASVSAIIIHFNSVEHTRNLVEALRSHCSSQLVDIIIVENGGVPASRACEDARVRFVTLPPSSSYADACNAGAATASGSFLLILNDDLDFDRDWLTPLVEMMAVDPLIGILAPALTYRDGRFQLSWGDDPTLLEEWRERRRQKEARAGDGPAYHRRAVESQEARDVDWVTGAVMLCRRAAFDGVAGFDAAYPFYYEDIDFCRRVRMAGYRIRYIPDVRIVHFLGGSGTAQHPTARTAFQYGRVRYYARYRDPISFLLVKLYFAAQATIQYFTFRSRSSRDATLHPWWSIGFRPGGPMRGHL